WPVHFAGWHFFRRDTWQVPPGRIGNFMLPTGTALVYTDSIPLVALVLKPVQAVLPQMFQYLGAWLALSFFLQGWFGALLAARFTRHTPSVVLGGFLFATAPTLAARLMHPALCAHWLLLWSIWLYFEALEGRPRIQQHAVLGLAAGLIHPYLALMVLAVGSGPLLLSLGPTPRPVPSRVASLMASVLALGIVTGWWASGLFSLTALADLKAGGVYELSMNLLGPITPSGWSSMLPELPVTYPGQRTEGLQYVGLGLAVLVIGAFGLVASRLPSSVYSWIPLIATAGLCATYSAALRLSIGSHILWTIQNPVIERWLVFRAPARFFWPLLYVALALSVGLLLRRTPPRLTTAILAVIILLQLVDVGPIYRRERARFHEASFYAWQPPLDPGLAALKGYAHMVTYPPLQCEAEGVPWMGWAFVAGSNGLTLNTGYAARTAGEATRSYCANLDRFVQSATEATDTLFVVTRARLARFEELVNGAFLCGEHSPDIFLCTVPAHIPDWPTGTVAWRR
ncbi:MAG: DUF6311 domain-containing protein, partial [Vicinamibacterales bacterium]